MIKKIVLLVLIITASYGCKMTWQYGESSSGCMIVDGKNRNFRYFIPEHAKGVILPLIVGLHGGGGNAKRFEKYSRFSEVSDKSASFIVVYPNGVDKHWNDGRKSTLNDTNDVEFIESLINILPKVDKKEVYVVGMSNGGVMAQKLACDIPEKLNGIAIVSATMSNTIYKECKDKKPLAALFIFGDNDTSFIKNGTIVSPMNQDKVRGRHIGIESTIKYWKERNLCKHEGFGKLINNHNANFGKFKDDRTKLLIHNFKGCKKGLKYYEIKGGGHRWPDVEASNGYILRKSMNLGNASHEINSAEEIVDFFHLIKR